MHVLNRIVMLTRCVRVCVQFDQLMKIIEVCGMPPQHMIEQSPKWRKFFDRRPDGSFEPKKPPKDDKRVRVYFEVKVVCTMLVCSSRQKMCAYTFVRDAYTRHKKTLSYRKSPLASATYGTTFRVSLACLFLVHGTL